MNFNPKILKGLKVLKKILYFFPFLIRERYDYTPLEEDEYLGNFGIEKDVNGNYKVTKPEILKEAYAKAWDNRNYEIDKFWTRAAYFWGFIVLIFGGYISVLTSEHNEKAIEMRLDMYLVLLGFLFSIAWYLVIRGSKFWQQNWEAHIDRLENYVSGPIYKTIHYSGNRSYSVSKLNEVMAIAVIVVWSSLLFDFIYSHFSFALTVSGADIQATIAILITILFAIVLIFGYCVGKYKSKKNSFFDRWE